MKKFSSAIIILLILVLLPSSVDAYIFLRNLQQGSSGVDVMELQKALNSNSNTRVSLSGAGSPGQETTYFGSATKRAVILFQELYRNEILVPAGLAQGNGFVGALTRQKLNNLAVLTNGTQLTATSGVAVGSTTPSGGIRIQTGGQSVASNAPVITSLSTTTIRNGDRITVYGKNFLPSNTVVVSIDLPDKYKDTLTASSTSLTFTFTSTISVDLANRLARYSPEIRSAIVDKIRVQMVKQAPSTDGTWYFPASISVKNTAGTSNAIPVMIDLLKGI